MRTLHLYLTRQVLSTLGITVAVFTFILLLGNVLKSVLGLLVNQQAGVLLAAKGILLLIPFVLVYALPIGMLTAMLLVFGRFSADNELTAARANGMSLAALATPLLFLSVLFSGVCAYINLEFAPKSRTAFKQLILDAAKEQFAGMVQEGVFIKQIPGVVFFAGGVEGNELTDVIYVGVLNDNGDLADIRAPRASYRLTDQNHLIFEFYDADVLYTTTGPSDQETKNYQGLTVELVESHPIALPEEISFQAPKPKELTLSQLIAEKEELIARGLSGTALLPIDIQIHSKLSFSFASFSFTLIGIPLGIRAHRRESSIGMAIAIVLMLVYNSFFVWGQSLNAVTPLPQLIVWAPNFLFQILGGCLFLRANRGV